MTRQIAALATALVVVLAGCAGGVGPGGDAGSEESATVNVYVSDQPNDIDDFESLNVTIDRVVFRGPNGSNETLDVEDETVDLTELQGANASQLGSLDVPPGEYDAVFLYVSDVDGDLKEGSTDVKLPSGALKLTKGFSVGPNESVDFVFDITVRKAGASGMYIIQPVVSESGTDVPIDTDGDGEDDRGEDESESEGENGDGGPPEDSPGDDESDEAGGDYRLEPRLTVE